MNAIYIQRGDSVDFIPESDIKAGDVIVQGELVGIAKLDIAAGSLGALAVAGVFEMPKVSSLIEAGLKVYWDGSKVTKSADDGQTPPVKYALVGKTISQAEAADETILVRLTQ